ncbi:MAG: ATP-binding protein [Candidatus Sericytochromatia bacterium]
MIFEIKKEEERLNKLYSFNILDTLPEESFDNITYLASIICNTPIAAITLIDKKRQWIKSDLGLNIKEIKREDSFCQYTILDNQVFIVEDTFEDDRFKNNNLVLNSPNIRFYAGAPLTTMEGYNIGAICVIDKKPNFLNEEQKKSLQILAKKVMTEMYLKETMKDYFQKLNTIQKIQKESQIQLSQINSLLESSDNFILLIDKDMKILSFNNKFKHGFELIANKKVEVNRFIYEYLEGINKESWLNNFKRSILGESFIKELDINLNGLTKYFETRFNPVILDENIIGVSIFALDITERKHQEIELIKAKKEAETSNIEKSMFLATMSHEIRNPMNGIISTIDLMEKLQTNPEQKRYLEILRVSSESLLSVVNDILDFSKIDSGKMTIENESFNLRTCIRNVYDILYYKVKENNSELNYNIAKEIPEFIKGDIVRLRQILLNLVGNAAKFTHRGKIYINIEVLEQFLDTKVKLRFSVSDTGIGIPEDKIKTIFNPYEQTDTSITKKYGGTGLGLSICKKLVELMGGKISVESKENIGTKFFFDLLFDIPNQEKVLKITMDSNVNDLLFKNIPLKILIAEDNIVNQILLSTVIKKIGYEPDVASNGLEAINMYKKNTYDLIFMDLQMPLMDGLKSSEEILKIGSPIIIAISGTNTDEEIEKCTNVGMRDFISKPFTFEVIKRTILKWMYVIKVK